MIEIHQSVAPVDEDRRVRVRDLPPGARVQLDARFVDDAQVAWCSRGVYFADADGTVDVARQASVGGSYLGVEPRGLLWSAAACDPDDRVRHLAARRAMPGAVGASTWTDPTSPVRISLSASLLEGHALQPRLVAQCEFVVERISRDVRTSVVRHGRIRGVLYEPAEVSASTPLAIAQAGSGGGIPAALAAFFASRGVAVLAMGVFAYEDLSPELVDIPLEQFAEGADWLARRHGRRRVGVIGGSRGGELALLLGASFPDRFSAVVGLCPAHVVHGGLPRDGRAGTAAWTLNGTALPFARFPEVEAAYGPSFWREREATHRPMYLEGWTPEVEAQAGIPVERSRAAILLISGAADELWPAAIASERAMRRLRSAGYAHPCRSVVFEGAGHWVTRPSGIDFGQSDGMVHPVLGAWMPLGGTAKANAEASLQGFRIACDWLKQHATDATN